MDCNKELNYINKNYSFIMLVLLYFIVLYFRLKFKNLLSIMELNFIIRNELRENIFCFYYIFFGVLVFVVFEEIFFCLVFFVVDVVLFVK